MPRLVPIFILAYLATQLASCGGAQHKRNYEKPEAATILKNLGTKTKHINSINTSSLMSYWQNGQRLKPRVLVMAQKGSYIRVNAMGLTEDVEADLACDGSSFRYQDFRNNCSLEGTCDRLAVSTLLKMDLTPDEFLLMAVGLSPLIDYTDSSLEWDGAQQQERIKLTNKETMRSQIIELDGTSNHWDLQSSKIYDDSGNLEWSIENKEFKDTRDENGKLFRAPEKTRFTQPSTCLLYTSPSPRDATLSRMPSSA